MPKQVLLRGKCNFGANIYQKQDGCLNDTKWVVQDGAYYIGSYYEKHTDEVIDVFYSEEIDEGKRK